MLLPVIVGQVSALVVLAVALAAPERSRVVRRPLAATGACIGAGTSLLAIAQFLSDDAAAPAWTFWVFFIVLLIALGRLLLAVDRLDAPDPEADLPRDPWKLGGLVYVNPDDPDIFVRQRLGIGMTINLGNPEGRLLVAALLVLVVVGTVIILLNGWTAPRLR